MSASFPLGNAIKIWPIAKQTFNEESHAGIDRFYFKQLYTLADAIVHQLRDTEDIDYRLALVNASTLEELGNVDYTKTANGAEYVFNVSTTMTILSAADGNTCLLYVYSIDAEDVETLVGKSDCILVKTSHAKTQLFKYFNKTDYAGVVYVADAPEFHIRLEAKFFRERFPSASESESTTDGDVEKLSSSLKRQKLLQLNPLPPYLLRIVKVALQHNSIKDSEDDQWVAEETYEETELNTKNPFSKVSIWLTDRSSHITNVYGAI